MGSSPCRWSRVLVAIVVCGLAVRFLHLARVPAVWHDEAALILNVLRLDHWLLLGPLLHDEAAPPLFLWLERSAYLLAGDSLIVLRAAPCLANTLALLLVAIASRSLLPGPAACLSAALFAFSDRLLWHACEAKPYSFDLLVAAGVLAARPALADRAATSRFLLWAVLSPAMVWLCYPGAFIAGALLVAELPAAWRERRSWPAYGLWAGALFASFALLVAGPASAQRTGPMADCWQGHFPDWSRPAAVPAWAAGSALSLGRYCLVPWGSALVPLAVVGGVAFGRSGRRGVVVLAAGPAVLALAAACLHRYPFGGSRLEVFVAPGLFLLASAGVAVLWRWLAGLHRFAPLPLIVLLVPGLAAGALSVPWPWPRARCDAAAQWVLRQQAAGEVVAVNHWEYLYTLRHAPGPVLLDASPAALTGCRAWVAGVGQDPAGLERWLAFQSAGWRVFERVDFPWAVAVRLEREGVSPDLGLARER